MELLFPSFYPYLWLTGCCYHSLFLVVVVVIVAVVFVHMWEVEIRMSVLAGTVYWVLAFSGQAEIALRLLKSCSEGGEWLCLKNLHLVTSWLPELEKEIKALKPHENFRLWLTSESHPNFPTILLQSSLKITYESPPGLKKVFVPDGINNSVGDYNSSRIGVVCRLSPVQNFNMGLFLTVRTRGLNFVVVLSYDMMSEILYLLINPTNPNHPNHPTIP